MGVIFLLVGSEMGMKILVLVGGEIVRTAMMQVVIPSTRG